jgi:hypothetical protein
MNPFVKTLVEKLPNQHHSKAIVVDNHLRVKGSPLGTVYCIGDSATVSGYLTFDILLDLSAHSLLDRNQHGRLFDGSVR